MSYSGVATNAAAFYPADESAGADDPFTAVNYHFGMLLGVDDFEAEFAYHRGHERLHQAWLHGSGVVWGLGVGLDFTRHEIRVARGLALDGAGRSLHLDADACLDPAAWYATHHSEVTNTGPTDGDVVFEAHVTASFASCLTRPVPALAEPCAGADVETAYSRVWETIDLQLVPGAPPEPLDRYRRVRILLGLLPPVEAGDTKKTDDDAAAARKNVLAEPAATRRNVAIAAFRDMANADAAQLAPPPGDDGPRVLTPDDPSAPVVLAHITGLTLARSGETLSFTGGTVDLLARRSHVATATIQELAVAALLAAPEPPAPPVDPTPPPAAAGVQGTKLDGKVVVVELTGPLDKRSVGADGFAVAMLTDDGWHDIALAAPPAYTAEPPTVSLTLKEAPAAPWLLAVRGSGPHPLLDEKLRPLGGGEDFVHIESELSP